ncbi:MAG: NIPSNAP family protein [Planctomycetota bacterium]
MKRREFVAASCLAGLAPLAATAKAAGAGGRTSKELYELRLIHMEDSGPKQKQAEDFLREAAIPALNRAGIKPVGVFRALEGDDPNVFLLLPHQSPESFIRLVETLGTDGEFFQAGAELLSAPKSDPAYKRMESSLLLAFDEHPKLTVPSTKESRIFQLRIYESHSIERGQKKIEMFNSGGEIAIFHRTGLNPVFFGEALIGSKLPNLTYMLGFDDQEALDKGWKAFMSDPGWIELRKDEQYKDTVSNITNILLRPAACSQI